MLRPRYGSGNAQESSTADRQTGRFHPAGFQYAAGPPACKGEFTQVPECRTHGSCTLRPGQSHTQPAEGYTRPVPVFRGQQSSEFQVIGISFLCSFPVLRMLATGSSHGQETGAQTFLEFSCCCSGIGDHQDIPGTGRRDRGSPPSPLARGQAWETCPLVGKEIPPGKVPRGGKDGTLEERGNWGIGSWPRCPWFPRPSNWKKSGALAQGGGPS